MIKTIAFDADDTLWHNECLYAETKRKLANLLSAYRAPEYTIQLLDRTEIHNLQYYGYGIKSFALSMIETAIEVTDGTIQGHELEAIIDYTKDTLSADVQLIPGAEQTVSELSGEYKLIMITKGDLFEQDRKVKLSGLADYFEHIEIVSDKSSAGYLGLLEKHRIKPREFLMVGNSLRSDILPVVAIGAQAVYIPYPDTWEHENTIEESFDETSFYRIGTIDQLPDLIRHLEKS